MGLWSIVQVSPHSTRKDKLWQVLLPLVRCLSGAFHQCRRHRGRGIGRYWSTMPSPSCPCCCSQPLLSQQRCYWHHGRWTEKSKQIAVEVTKGTFADQNTLGGYLQCSSGWPMYLMKQQPSRFHVICPFCQKNVFSIPIFGFFCNPS